MIKLRALIVPLGVFLLVAGLGACGDSDSSDSEDNKEVVTRFVQEFKNNANHNIVDELMTPGFVHHLTDPRLPAGRDGMKAVGQSVVGGFPDVQATVQDLLADGDHVIERTSVRATHTGEFNGIPATGRPVASSKIHIYRFEDGKIAEMWSEVDFLGLLVQLGVVPRP
jgi:predicted ester cyclase